MLTELRTKVGKWIIAGVVLIISMGVFTPIAYADPSLGSKVFNANCAACHIGGGNVVQAQKTLKLEALQKYGMDSIDAIVAQVTGGKNAMPAFKGKLKADQINDVAEYVLAQANNGWKKG